MKKNQKITNFSAAITLISNKGTARTVTEFNNIIQKLEEQEKKVVSICLLLNFKPILTNIAFQILNEGSDANAPFFERFIEKDISIFCEYLPKIYTTNEKYFTKITNKLIEITPDNKIDMILQEFKKIKIQNCSKSVYANCIIRGKESSMLEFLESDEHDANYQNIFKKIVKNSQCCKFSELIIAKICLLFLSGALKFNSDAFDAFCFYFSRTYFPFAYNSALDQKEIAVLFIQHVFATIPSVKNIVSAKLIEKMNDKQLNDDEAATLVNILDDNELLKVLIKAVKNKGPMSIISNLSARSKEKSSYQDMFNISFPYFITTVQLNEANTKIFIDEMHNLTQFMYMPFIICKALDNGRKDIITKYAEYNTIAQALVFIMKLCNSAKKSFLKPIEKSFADHPGQSFTALYLLSNSKFIEDVTFFKRIIKSITKVCIKEDFSALVQGYNFPSRVKKFFLQKYDGVVSAQKFFLKVYLHKSVLELSESRILKHLNSLIITEPTKTSTAPSTPEKSEIKAERKIPQTEKKPYTKPIKELQKEQQTPTKLDTPKQKEKSSSEILSPLPTEEKQDEVKQETEEMKEDKEKTEEEKKEKPKEEFKTPEKKGSWSLFGLFSHFGSSPSIQQQETPKKQTEETESKPELSKNVSSPQLLKPQRIPLKARQTCPVEEIPRLEVPSDDMISSDPELDKLSEDSESNDKSDSSSEPLGDLNSQWAF